MLKPRRTFKKEYDKAFRADAYGKHRRRMVVYYYYYLVWRNLYPGDEIERNEERDKDEGAWIIAL